MNQPTIFITTKDAAKLRKLIREAFHTDYRGSDYLEKLSAETKKASVADVSQGKISILAPIGTAVLGYKTGDTFAWDTPGGKRASSGSRRCSINQKRLEMSSNWKAFSLLSMPL